MKNDGKERFGPDCKSITKKKDICEEVCYIKTEWKKKLVGFKYIKVGNGHLKPKFIKKPIFRMVPVHFKVCKMSAQ